MNLGDAKPTAKSLALSKLRLDGGTQPRVRMDQRTVEEYADALRDGAKFPPVVVFYDGSDHWLADGFHRQAGHQAAGRRKIVADVYRGTRRDAILYSLGANGTHGLRRSNADKRRAVETVLRDAEWSKKSDRWVAERCGVSHPFVLKVRSEVVTVTTSTVREGRDGKHYTVPAPAPSRPSRPAQTTVTYDGDPGPDDDVWEPDEESAEEDDSDSREAAGDRALERVQRHAEAGTLAPAASDRLTVTPDKKGRDGGGFTPAGEAKPPTWREVLEIPAGRVAAQTVVDHHARLLKERPSDDHDGIDRALAVGLSQWNTSPREADLVAEIALSLCGDRRALHVLEPSAGDGALLKGLFRAIETAKTSRVLGCVAIEIDPTRAAELAYELEGGKHEAEVLPGDFLRANSGEAGDLRLARPFDLTIMNPPYEGGADGAFLAHAMTVSERIVALLRLNALTGQRRHEEVWSQVATARHPDRPWHLQRLEIFPGRPEFIGPGDGSAKSDYVIVGLVHRRVLAKSDRGVETRVGWP